MKYKPSDLIVFWVLISTLFAWTAIWSQDEREPDERIHQLSKLERELLDKRVAELKAKKLEECRLKAFKDAEIWVDSTIIREALEARIGAEGIPYKPIRPNAPEVILKADSLDVAPLFDEKETPDNQQ
jgi:hypothetical protein